MESDLFNGSLPFPVNFTTLAIALALLLAALAFTRGVIGMFVGLVCLLTGAFVAYSSHSLIPGWLSHISEDPSPRFVFFIAVAIGFSVYVSSFGRYNETYGALGAAVVLLLWFWLMFLAILIGAELNEALILEQPDREIQTSA